MRRLTTAEVDRFEAGLTIRGASFDPDAATAHIGLTPTCSFHKGEVYRSSRGVPMTRPWGLWRYSLMAETPSLDPVPVLRAVVATLDSRRDRLGSYLGDPAIRSAAFIHWEPAGGSGGYTLPTDLVSILSELANEFDFYFS